MALRLTDAQVAALGRAQRGVVQWLRHAALLDFDHGVDASLVRGRQLAEVVSLTPWMMLANIANATIMLSSTWGGGNNATLGIWAGAIWGVSLWTLVKWWQGRGKPRHNRASSNAIVRATRHAGVLGAAWGLLPLLILPQGNVTAQVLTTNVIAGMAASGAFALAAIPAAATAYLVLLLVPALIAISIEYIPASMPLLDLGIIYLLTLAITIIARYREFSMRVRDQFKLQKQSETIAILLKDFESSASDWLWETDGDGRISYASTRMAQVTGLEKSEIVGKPFTALVGTAAEAAEWRDVTARLRDKASIRDAVVPVRLGDKPTWWSLTAGPVTSPDGSFAGYRGVGTDITERRNAEIALAEKNEKLATFNVTLEAKVAARTEEARHAAELAQEASRAKSLFLANMSHEIRTPMNGVFGMTDLLRRTVLTHRQRRLVDTISSSATTLLGIINDILDLSRIEAGKLELDNQDFDLRRCVEGAVELFVEEADRKRLELTVLLASDVPAFVNGDSGRLRQICVNLLGNAMKFTSKGEVALRVSLDAIAPDGVPRIVIEVRDSGIGMAPDVLARIAQPFVQADSSVTRRFGGTGLGLSISKQLVALMAGELSIRSEIGTGTMISVSIPLRPATTQAAASAVTDYVALCKKRFLVVDDRESNCEIARVYLEGAGADVECVRSASEALTALRLGVKTGRPFAAAIVDQVMPGQSGIELARLLKADEKLAATVLVLATSMSWKGDAKAARDAGIREILVKPFRHADLLDAVTRALTGPLNRRASDAPTQAALPQFDARVLLAEDNPVNQEVALEYLKAFGCQVDIANNGVEAVAAADHWHYDIILMDCQMPEMDGYTATHEIRAMELAKLQSATPIVALTANAFAADRQKSLDAGMNDHLSKPFSEAELAAVLVKALKPKLTSPAKGALDLAAISGLLQRKPALFERLARIYLEFSGKAVDDLERALANKDCEQLKLTAHSLKSSSANVGATVLADFCKKLEVAAGFDDLVMAEQLVTAIVRESQDVRAALTIEAAKITQSTAA